VRVERGPLRGLEGTLLRDGDEARLVVSVEMLQRSIAAEVDPDMVVPLRSLERGTVAQGLLAKGTLAKGRGA
jgi:hypothetical protein